ncbi:cytochrome P450 78A7 [Cynara cardunculus var. scolymus]|uniref:Cytochrome P450 n=1 Tax=Cynara cardunculus var. scolymus TaxID=59895 RepID=A0A118JYH0_CYNCS|nr:cytochrome P450 78A7 [Cynara cardunculus var. scolymus]KVH98589.1 cytochrome P450 [Cynara cardunculus var. scolymus]
MATTISYLLRREDMSWWAVTHPLILQASNLNVTFVFFYVVIAFSAFGIVAWTLSCHGGPAWKNGRNRVGCVSIPSPTGLPIFGSLLSLVHGLPHRTLASMARTSQAATQLMAISIGNTATVVASDPQTAREILTSQHFANRPIKQSAKLLLLNRAIGFAPDGPYWRQLRKIASSHLLAPKHIFAHEPTRRLECTSMLNGIAKEQSLNGFVVLRKHLQTASLNNIMEIVFGKSYNKAGDVDESMELQEMVTEGFELLGAFNWSDHLPWLKYFYDPLCINHRCKALVPRVKIFVQKIINEHKLRGSVDLHEGSDFVDVLLSLDGEEKLSEDDMVAILWEMVFRGTDTIALLTEWVMAELVLNKGIQSKLRIELDNVMGDKSVNDAEMAKLPYLQAVIKEALRLHPPGPLLSWARLSTSDVHLTNGMVIPSNTTAMVNMWAITHNSDVWDNPFAFEPERFLLSAGGSKVDIRGRDLRLAPFGAGRRVCPGMNLGMVTVSRWVAMLVNRFDWVQDMARPVDLTEVLKLSCEMKEPLYAKVVSRNDHVSSMM